MQNCDETALIHIVLAANHKYMPGLLVTLSSIARSASDKNRLRFHVISDGLSVEDRGRIFDAADKFGASQPIIIEADYSRVASLFCNQHYPYMVFLRLFYCEMFDVDWVLHTDVDTLWMRDVCELWALRDNSKIVQWCRDIPSIAHGVKAYSKWNLEFDEERYCCAGVMLMNLRRMRETGFAGKCIDFVTKWGTPLFVDQDIINYVCRHDSGILPQHWDCMMPTKAAVDGLVYHVSHIGQMFNDKYSGWQPLQYPWFRYYYDFILNQPQKAVCGFYKRLFHWLMGTFYPNRRFSRFLAIRLPDYAKDSFYRQLFFAWLWRHAKWRWQPQCDHGEDTKTVLKST